MDDTPPGCATTLHLRLPPLIKTFLGAVEGSTGPRSSHRGRLYVAPSSGIYQHIALSLHSSQTAAFPNDFHQSPSELEAMPFPFLFFQQKLAFP